MSGIFSNDFLKTISFKSKKERYDKKEDNHLRMISYSGSKNDQFQKPLQKKSLKIIPYSHLLNFNKTFQKLNLEGFNKLENKKKKNLLSKNIEIFYRSSNSFFIKSHRFLDSKNFKSILHNNNNQFNNNLSSHSNLILSTIIIHPSKAFVPTLNTNLNQRKIKDTNKIYIRKQICNIKLNKAIKSKEAISQLCGDHRALYFSKVNFVSTISDPRILANKNDISIICKSIILKGINLNKLET